MTNEQYFVTIYCYCFVTFENIQISDMLESAGLIIMEWKLVCKI